MPQEGAYTGRTRIKGTDPRVKPVTDQIGRGRMTADMAAEAAGRTPSDQAINDDFARRLQGGADAQAGKTRPTTPFEDWKAARMAGENQTVDVERDWLARRTKNPSPRGPADVAGGRYPEIRASMAESGWDSNKPLHTVYDYKTGEFTVYDGTHRLALADELGMKKIPVEFTGNADLQNTFKMLQREFPEKHGGGLRGLADAGSKIGGNPVTSLYQMLAPFLGLPYLNTPADWVIQDVMTRGESSPWNPKWSETTLA